MTTPELPQPPDPREAPPLRWGVLGAGHIGARFAREVPARSTQQVLAVGSRTLEKAAEFARQTGLPRVHGSYADLVADPEIDAVYVASPHSHHAEHALLALEAGKHVLVEKAFTRNAAEAREVFAAAERHGLFAMEAMWTRFLPHMIALRALVASGALGEILLVRGDHGRRLGHVPRLREPGLAGGALLDLGVYPVSFVHSILGAPESVHASGLLTPEGVDAHEVITLSYGRAAGLATANMWAGSATDAAVIGTEARVELPTNPYVPNRFDVIPVDGEPWSLPAPDPELGGFQYQAAEVARGVAAGRQESETLPWRATVEVMEIMDEARRQLGVVYPGE